MHKPLTYPIGELILSLIPNTYKLLSISNNGDAVVFTRDESTPQQPKEIVVSRSKASFNNTTAKFSVPQYSANISQGTMSGEPPVPQAEKLSIKVIARVPVSVTSADLAEALSDFRAVVNSDEFAADIVSLYIPLCCPSAE